MRDSRRPPQASSPDWHPADIVCALHKSGWTLRRLSRHHGYRHAGTLRTAIQRPWPKGERLIAAAIGVAPEVIWPSRYASLQSSTRPDGDDVRRTMGTESHR